MTSTDSHPSLSRREQKKIHNRQLILDAGKKIFAELGFEAATISDIVQCSGLSVGTFYNYFGDKESVMREIVAELLTTLRQPLSATRAEATGMDNFVLNAFIVCLSMLVEDKAALALVTRNPSVFRRYVMAAPQLEELVYDLEQDMQNAVDSGLLPTFPVRMMTSAMVGAAVEVFVHEADSGNLDPHTAAQFLSDLFIGGIDRLGRLAQGSSSQGDQP